VKKRLTFGFLPWVAAAGACIGGGFVRGQDAATSVPADASVLVGGAAAAPAAAAPAAAPAAPAAVIEEGAVEGAVVSEGGSAPCTTTRKVWKWVPEVKEVEATEYTTEVRERSFTVNKKVPRVE